MLRHAIGLSAFVVTLGVAAIVHADVVVVVHAAGNSEGVMIVVTDQSGAAHTCTTDATGSCELAGVIPGSAFVESHAPGAVPSGHHVMIPPDGKVSLIVPDAPRTDD